MSMAMILLNVSHSRSVFTISLPNSGPYCQIVAQGFYLAPTLFLRKFHFPNRSPGALIGKPRFLSLGKLGASATCNYWSNLWIKYPLWLGGPRHCKMQSLPYTSTYDQHLRLTFWWSFWSWVQRIIYLATCYVLWSSLYRTSFHFQHSVHWSDYR